MQYSMVVYLTMLSSAAAGAFRIPIWVGFTRWSPLLSGHYSLERFPLAPSRRTPGTVSTL